MPVLTRLRAGNPLAFAVLQRRFPVETGRRLQAYPGALAGHARDKTDIQFVRLVRHEADIDRNARRLQLCQPATGDQRIRVGHRRNNAPDPGSQQGFGAWWGTAVMAARLQRHVGRCTARCRIGLLQGIDFRMRLARPLVPAFTDDHAITDDDTANTRIRRSGIQASLGQTQGLRHVRLISRRNHVFRGEGCETSRMMSENSSTSSKFR